MISISLLCTMMLLLAWRKYFLWFIILLRLCMLDICSYCWVAQARLILSLKLILLESDLMIILHLLVIVMSFIIYPLLMLILLSHLLSRYPIYRGILILHYSGWITVYTFVNACLILVLIILGFNVLLFLLIVASVLILVVLMHVNLVLLINLHLKLLRHLRCLVHLLHLIYLCLEVCKWLVELRLSLHSHSLVLIWPKHLVHE